MNGESNSKYKREDIGREKKMRKGKGEEKEEKKKEKEEGEERKERKRRRRGGTKEEERKGDVKAKEVE